MKVLIVGGGGREHAIALKIKENPEVTALYAAPGNGGIAQIATCLPFKATDVDGIVRWAADKIAFTDMHRRRDIGRRALAAGGAGDSRVRPAQECRDYRGQQSVLEEPDEEVRHSDGGV